MSPLFIRRIIDYGVGYKKNWETLSVPGEFSEGFWNVDDSSGYLGPAFSLSYFKTYRHLGDSRGDFVIGVINRLLGGVLKRQGTNFIAVWAKRCRH